MNKDILQRAPETVEQDVSLESLQALLRIFYFKYLEKPTEDLVEQEVRAFPLSEYELGLPSERVKLYQGIQEEIKTLAALKKLRARLKIQK